MEDSDMEAEVGLAMVQLLKVCMMDSAVNVHPYECKYADCFHHSQAIA